MVEQIKIKTVTPFHAPLSIALGVDQSSNEYTALLNRIVESNAHCTPIHRADIEHDYDAIENDARDIRLLHWQSQQDSKLSIHLFPNNVAIAELALTFDANLTSKQIAQQSQALTKAALEDVYSEFISDLAAFANLDKALRLGEVSEKLRVHWISRFLILTKEQLTHPSVQTLTSDWLKDTQNPLDAQAIIAGDKDHSMTWLHYAIVDEKHAEEEHRVSTMILAQYFYTAQENCNRLLKQAIDSAYNSNNRTLTEKRLSFARVVTRLHLIDLNEHKKFLNRYKRKLLDSILASWDFDEVAANGQRMIEVCTARLDEADNKRRERSTVMTDLLLVTLSFFAVFELSLYLTEFSREMMSRPALDYNDENRSFFLEFIAEIDADVMFAFGFGLTFALVIIYKVIKGK